MSSLNAGVSLLKFLLDRKGCPYEDKVSELSRERKKQVARRVLRQIGQPPPMTLEEFRTYFRKQSMAYLSAHLSAFIRRDVCYARADLEEVYGFLENWRDIRSLDGKHAPHPTELFVSATLLSLQWRFAEAAALFLDSARLTLERPNKYPALPSLFNASYCLVKCAAIDESKEALHKLEEAIQLMESTPDWRKMYRQHSLGGSKTHEPGLWLHLAWCDHYIHHPDWFASEKIRASFNAKWDILTGGDVTRGNTLTIDLAAVIFCDPEWAFKRSDLVQAVYKTIRVETAGGPIARLPRKLRLMFTRSKIDFSHLRRTAALWMLMVLTSFVHLNAAGIKPAPLPHQSISFVGADDICYEDI